MVVSKAEVCKKLNLGLLGQFNTEIEPKMDKALGCSGKCTLPCKGLSSDMIDFVIKKYKEAGWTVIRHTGDDIRNCESWDYLVISY